MGATVTVGTMVLLFVPRWLENIRPINPANRWAGQPVYPRSILTAVTVDSGKGPTASGTIVVPPTREELLAHEAAAVGARRARKEARAREMSGPRAWSRADARTERAAAKEARRIMMARRAACLAAFAKEE